MYYLSNIIAAHDWAPIDVCQSQLIDLAGYTYEDNQVCRRLRKQMSSHIQMIP